jgi:FMN-dependent NADH-azoreductase
MKLLHIISSPRGAASNTLRVSSAFTERLQIDRGDVTVDEIDLYHRDLPSMAGANVEAKYTLMVGQPIDPDHADSWREIEAMIDHFKSADAYVISAPMWNLSIPYALKYYIDCIVQPGYAFTYNERGQVVPLVHGKKMICVTSRGGDYSANSPMNAFDFQVPYLRAIFGFIGITDIEFINVEPTDINPDLRHVAVTAAIEAAQNAASRPDWVGLGAEVAA